MEKHLTNSRIDRVAFIGNYLPRQCGIATFTTDLCESFAEKYCETTCIAIPVNDIKEGYSYPSRVRFELIEKDISSYHRAADFLNINNVDIVCLQFEFGIFGGKAGSHIIALLKELRMPIVTTLHTILREPDANQRIVFEKIVELSARLVVMSKIGVEILQQVYGVSPDKIDLIPHGIPDVTFLDSSFNKDLFGVEEKIVLLSFGLLSDNKGIEDVISALPKIVEKYSNVVYFIVGATHPHVIRNEGETYRLSLQLLAQEKGVEGHIVFCNRFVTLKELVEFISIADIYITPYRFPAQIVSGTLAYTLGAGKAIISTPYWYAEEMLAEDRGVLVPFCDPSAIADQVINLLDNEAKRHAMRKRAYLYGRNMIWSNVVNGYMKSFSRAREECLYFHLSKFIVKPIDKRPKELPILKLDHLFRMTDDTGILQHAIFTIPNYSEGYTTDDNARALIVSTLLEELGNEEAFKLSSRYLAFLLYAYNSTIGRFRNFMDYQRNWLEDCGSDDSHGRALWALGTVLGRSNTPAIISMAGWVFENTLPAILDTTSPRAWAFALIGIHEYLQRFEGDRKFSQTRDELGKRLFILYQNTRSDEWQWYEETLTYCNALLPHALLLCGQSIQNELMINAALESLNWLSDLQKASTAAGHFIPIGSNGFYHKGKERSRFDQQPVEAQTMISCCLSFFRITQDKRWYNEARRVFDWFLGRNDLNIPIYDPTTGGCRDGLHSDRLNENQGAESSLAFLQAVLELRLADIALLTDVRMPL